MKKNHHKSFRNLLCIALAAATMFAFSGCTKADPDKDNSSQSSSSSPSSSSSISNPITPPTSSKPAGKPVAPPKTVSDQIATAKKQNSDVVGWIRIPNTEIDNEVLQANDNDYYARKDITKNYNWHGCYYADAGNTLKSRKELNPNTIIYGHNMDDKPTGLRFAQLTNYLDEEFAKKNPYIYLTTEEDEMIFQVFAVFYTDTNFQYHLEDPAKYYKATDKNKVTMKDIISGAKARSEWIYDVEVDETDKLITLSTCTYKFSQTDYELYRYVVQGRLLRPGEEVKDSVMIKKNPSPILPKVA